MNRSLRVQLVAPLALFSALAAAPALRAQASTQPPVNWEVTGMAAQLYAIVGISDGGHTLSLTRLVNVVEGPNQFGATAAIVTAESYRGRRVRLRALIRADSASTGATTWLRIDADTGMLALDNNMTRPLVGTTGWTEQVTVMDVPPNARRIVYGLILLGGGTVHAKEVTLDAVQVPPGGQ